MAGFTWGAGGAQLTPESIASQRKVAQAMMERGMDYSPIKSGWQGAARVAQAMLGGLDEARLDSAEKANGESNKQMIAGLLAGQGGGAAAPDAVPAVAAPAQPATGNISIPQDKTGFVSTMMPLAQEQGARTGLDPRLIVAQAALESGYGAHAPGGNYFGIKSHGAPGGQTLPTTEVVNGQPVQTTDSFRTYPSPADSAKGYGDFILANPRYKPVMAAQGLDAQINAMGQSGYATDPQYGAKLRAIASGLPAPPGAPTQIASADPSFTPDSQPSPSIAAASAPSPVKVAQAPTAMPAGGVNPAVIQAMTSPVANPQTRALATSLFNNQLKGDTTDEIKEYNLYARQEKAAGRQPSSFFDYKSGIKKAGAQNITIDQKPELAFDTKAGQLQAERFNDLASDGQNARQMISDVNTLTELGKNIGTGKTAEFKAAIGPYAEAFGAKIDGLSDIQAFEAIVNRVAPNLRVKGSGAQSDYELKNFLKSLPTLGNTPEGNAMASEVMKGLQENKIRAAEIGSKALNKELTRSEAEKQLRELPDPMENFRKFTKERKQNAVSAAPQVDPAALEEARRRGLIR